MAKAKSDAVWSEINPDTLASEMAKAFETIVSEAAELPAGKRVVFGYNFGKLSVAIVDDDCKPAKATQPCEIMR